MAVRNQFSGGDQGQLANDPGRMAPIGTGDGNQIAWGTVGHENEANPAFVEIVDGQVYAEVTIRPEGDKIRARVAFADAGAGSGDYKALTFGCRVIVQFVDGDQNDAVIVGRMYDKNCAMPDTVAGVATGAAGKTGEITGPAPMWQFIKTPSGQLLAIESGSNGDIMIHSSASLLIKTGPSGAVQIDGEVHLGAPPTTDPVGATVGPAGTQIPGVPAVKSVSLPFTPVPNETPAHIPYVGFADGIIRAKDNYQFTAASDPIDYPFFAAVYAHPLIGLPPPQALVSEPRGGGAGSKHTASD